MVLWGQGDTLTRGQSLVRVWDAVGGGGGGCGSGIGNDHDASAS